MGRPGLAKPRLPQLLDELASPVAAQAMHRPVVPAREPSERGNSNQQKAPRTKHAARFLEREQVVLHAPVVEDVQAGDQIERAIREWQGTEAGARDRQPAPPRDADGLGREGNPEHRYTPAQAD